MICSNCGYDVEPGKRFCPNCGCPMPEEEVTETKDSAAEETQATEETSAAPEEKPAEEAPEETAEETPEEAADAAEAPAEEDAEVSAETPEEAPSEEPAPEKPQEKAPEKPKPVASGKKTQKAEKKSVLRDSKAFPKLIIERNYLLSYVLGGVFFSLFTTFSNRMAARFDGMVISANSVSLNLMSFVNLLIFGVTIGAMLLSHIVKKKTGAHIISMIGVIAAVAIEILWIFLCLALGHRLLGLYFRSADAEMTRAAVVLFRRIGIGALIMTLVSAVLGFVFHWKRCWIYLAADAAVVIIALIVLLFGVFVFRKPGPIAAGIGMAQAGIYLFPAIGFNVLGGKTAETEQQ